MTISVSSQPDQILRADQALELRALVAKRKDSATDGASNTRHCHSIAISGGKGGVGRSVIALNLAIGFAQRGATVGLIDASQDLGSVELLCGLNSYWNLSHVVQGSRQISDIVQTGPAGIRVLTGASCLVNTDIRQNSQRNGLLAQLKTFEQELDWLIIDGSGGACAMILDQLQNTAHSFLRIDLHRRGYLPQDQAVQVSVNGRTPFVVQSPQSSVTTALFELIQRWSRPQSTVSVNDYFTRLLF